MKKEVPLNQAKWIIEPGCVVLVTGGTMEHANLMTFSWQTPIHTANPCMVLLVMSQVRYTYELIKQNNELVINVPGETLLEATHMVGSLTGRGIDKFARSGLTPVAANVVKPPLIAECAGHLECRIVETHPVRTHDLLICDVVHASADTEFFDGAWIPEKLHTLHYLRGTKYGLLERRVEVRGAQ
ncbi:MAG: flavin reductase family protein [Planctomycetota bacterium]|jgi:flavin reductase (DIM6/NTAB) family NADH-FMN oxidoreductase RutF